MKQTVFCGLFFVLAGLSLGSCQRSDSPTVAKIGTTDITVSELRSRLESTPAAYRQYAASAEGRKQFLKILIREKVLLAEAKRIGIPNDASYKEAIERFDADAKQRAKEYKETLLVESTLRKLRAGILAASDTEVEKFYQDNRAIYEKPVEISAAHILVATEDEAQKALTRLKNGDAFDKVAREVSKDPATAVQGGKLAPFRAGTLVPEFEAAALPLKTGALSAIVKTQFGFHIIKKLGEKALPARSLVDAKEEIRARLERQKFDEWIATREKAIGVRVNEDDLSRLSLEETPKP